MRRTKIIDKQCNYKRCTYRRMKRRKYCEKHVNMVEFRGSAQSVIPVIQEAYTKDPLKESVYFKRDEKKSLWKRIKGLIIIE